MANFFVTIAPGLPYSTFNDTGSSRNVWRTPDSVIHVCYTTTNFYHAYSSDNGHTWTIEQIDTVAEVFDSTRPYCQAMCVDSLGNCHFAYASVEGANREIIYRKKASGGAWGATVIIALALDFDTICMATYSNDDFVIVFWADSIPIGNDKIIYIIGHSDGTWDAAGEILFAASTSRILGSIAIDWSDNLHVCFEEFLGAWWGTVYGIVGVGYEFVLWAPSITYESMCVDSSGNIHVTYGSGGDIYYRYRTPDPGGSWQVAVNLTNVGAGQQDPRIRCDSLDDLHVIWTGTGWVANLGFRNLQSIKRTGGVWGTRQPITDLAFNQDYISLLWTPFPTLNVEQPYRFIWTATTGVGTYDVKYNHLIIPSGCGTLLPGVLELLA